MKPKSSCSALSCSFGDVVRCADRHHWDYVSIPLDSQLVSLFVCQPARQPLCLSVCLSSVHPSLETCISTRERDVCECRREREPAFMVSEGCCGQALKVLRLLPRAERGVRRWQQVHREKHVSQMGCFYLAQTFFKMPCQQQVAPNNGSLQPRQPIECGDKSSIRWGHRSWLPHFVVDRTHLRRGTTLWHRRWRFAKVQPCHGMLQSVDPAS